MFKNLKLLATMIGLVAVLVMGLAMPVVTQQNPLARQGVTNAIGNALQSVLTAAGEVILDPEGALFLSGTGVTAAFIPLSKVDEPRIPKLLADILDGKGGSVTVGAIYIIEPIKVKSVAGREVSLNQGVYWVRVVDKDRAVLIDAEGNEAVTVHVEMEKYPLEEQDKIARGVTIHTSRIVEEAPRGIEFIRIGMVLSESPPAYSTDTASSIVIAGEKCDCLVKILVAIALILAAL